MSLKYSQKMTLEEYKSQQIKSEVIKEDKKKAVASSKRYPPGVRDQKSPSAKKFKVSSEWNKQR